jgi:hypothetical protein
VTEAEMREVISAAFVTGWTAAQPSVQFALENELGKLPPVGQENFALLTVAMTSSGQRTKGARGNRRVERQGWAQVKLWTPCDTGAGGAAALAGSVRAILEMVSISGPGSEPVVTQAAVTQPGGTDGRWYMSLVRIPLSYTETK